LHNKTGNEYSFAPADLPKSAHEKISQHRATIAHFYSAEEF
jgi:hypothetical protein